MNTRTYMTKVSIVANLSEALEQSGTPAARMKMLVIPKISEYKSKVNLTVLAFSILSIITLLLEPI